MTAAELNSSCLRKALTVSEVVNTIHIVTDFLVYVNQDVTVPKKNTIKKKFYWVLEHPMGQFYVMSHRMSKPHSEI